MKVLDRPDPFVPWNLSRAGGTIAPMGAMIEMTDPEWAVDAALPSLGPVRVIVADRGYRGLGKMAAKRSITLDSKAPPKGTGGSTPIAPLYRVEHAFARLGRWRRLSRCHEGTSESARAWLQVASLAHLFARLRVEPA